MALVPFVLDGTLHPPGDIVLLLNAATEAMSARNLIHAMCRTESEVSKYLERLTKGDCDESWVSIRRPWIVSVTSKKDRATEVAFPIGIVLESVMRRSAHRELENVHTECDRKVGDLGTFSELVTRTVGHHAPLFSHNMEQVPIKKALELKAMHPANNVVFTVGGVGYVLKANSRNHAHREYWVAQAPESLIEGHGNVLTSETLEMVIGLLDYNQVFKVPCVEESQNSRECVSVERVIHAAQETERP